MGGFQIGGEEVEWSEDRDGPAGPDRTGPVEWSEDQARDNGTEGGNAGVHRCQRERGGHAGEDWLVLQHEVMTGKCSPGFGGGIPDWKEGC